MRGGGRGGVGCECEEREEEPEEVEEVEEDGDRECEEKTGVGGAVCSGNEARRRKTANELYARLDAPGM